MGRPPPRIRLGSTGSHVAGAGLAALCALTALGPGCSLLGLDRLPQSSCIDMGGDAFCASLNDSSPTGDACLRWQCNEVSTHCEIEPRDMDADGAPAASCEPAGALPDCADDDATNSPLLTESCDGSDDDCDDAVDEGTVGRAALVSLRDLPAGTTDVVFGRAPDADQLAVAALTGTGEVSIVTDAAVAGLIMAPVRRTTAGTAIVPSGLTAVEGLGTNRYALLFELSGSCRRVVLGILDTTSMLVRVPDAHEAAGFPSRSGDCTSGGAGTSTAGMARDAASGDLLVAYLEGARRDCGTTAAAPVLVVGAPDALPAASVTPLTLGESVDPRPPAVLALGGRAFLVAFPVAGGGVEVHRVTVAADGTPSATLAYTESGDAGGLRGDVRLALGRTDGATTTAVGLAYAYGCGAAAPALRLLSVTSGAVTAGARVAGTTATGARMPFAVYQRELDEWLLGWRTRMTLGAIRIDAASMRIGDGFDLTTAAGGFESPFMLVAPGRAAGAAYRLLTARAEGGTTRAAAAELGCLPPVASP